MFDILGGFDLGFSHFADDFLDDLAEITLLAEPDSFTQVIFLEYVGDFIGFCEKILGVKFWDLQAEIAELVQKHPKVAIAACYASGKTYLAACLVIWWLWTRRPCLCVTTAPTGRQVRELLWAEVKKIHLAATVHLGGKILVRETRISPDRRGLGFAGDKPNSVAGYHERENILFIEDEAAGMKRVAVQGMDGLTATSGSKWIKIGNPVADEGPFWDCFNDPDEKQRWVTYQISAYNSPNVKGKGALAIGFGAIPGLAFAATWWTLAESVAFAGPVGYTWVRDRESRWGNEHPLFVTKVLGRWYITVGGKVVVPSEWVQLAIERGKQYLEGGEKKNILGVDVGGGEGGDYTVLFQRHKRKAKRIAAWNQGEMPEQADRVADWIEKLKIERACIDGTGLGATMYGCLKRLKRDGRIPNCELCLVKFNNKTSKPDEFSLLVDELWWAMRFAFDPKNPEAIGIDARDRELVEELPKRQWSLVGDGDGVIKIESKREMRLKRHIGTPDDADSLATTFYKPKNTGRAFAA